MSTNEFIQRYRRLFEKDPSSKVFAPLAEALRRAGALDEAISTAQRGVASNPNFASGHLALAQALAAKQRWSDALTHARHACDLSPENLLAHRTAADAAWALKQPDEALKAYKMVLFLSPDDAAAAAQVRKLEALTAEGYDDDLFQPARLPSLQSPAGGTPEYERELQRQISLIDAFMTRGDLARARELLDEALQTLGPHPALRQRLEWTENDAVETASAGPSPQGEAQAQAREAEVLVPHLSTTPPVSRPTSSHRRKIQTLQLLLTRVQSRAREHMDR